MSKSSVRYYGVELRGTRERYIQYYHRIPRDLPRGYWKKEWLDSYGNLAEYGRFRVKQWLNREVSPFTGEEVCALVKQALEGGFNPFDAIMEVVRETQQPVAGPGVLIPIQASAGISLKEALEQFMAKYPEFITKNRKTKKNPTWEHNLGTKTMLLDYFKARMDEPVAAFTRNDLDDCLRHNETVRGWKKSSYNDRLRKVKTFFNYLIERELIEKSPMDKLKPKTKVARTKHAYFDPETLTFIFKKMAEHADRKMGTACRQFFEAIYYTCTRPNEETHQLECGDILWKEKKIYIDPERAKGGAGGHIPLDPEFARILRKMGADKCPKNWLIFGKDLKPGPKWLTANTFADWFRDEIRRPNGLDEKYTPYGMKHTRIRDLYNAGATISEIQVICRHESPSMTEKYLKELGCLVDQSVVTKSKRKL